MTAAATAGASRSMTQRRTLPHAQQGSRTLMPVRPSVAITRGSGLQDELGQDAALSTSSHQANARARISAARST